MTTRAAIAAALMKGGRAPDTPVAVIASGTTASAAGGADDAGRAGRRRPRAAGRHRRGPGGRARSVRRGPPASGGPAGRAHRGGHAHGRARPRLVDALERAGATALELPLTRQVDPADGGAALQAAAAAVREYDWVVLTSVNCGGPLHGRPARRPRPRRRHWWPPSDRPRPTRCAGPASSPTWCRPSTAPRGSSTRSPTRRSTAPGACCSRAPTSRLQTIPDGLGQQGVGRARRRGVPHGGARRARAGAAGPGGRGRCADVHRPLERARVRGPAHARMASRCPRRRTSSASGRPRPRRPGRPGSTNVHEARGASAQGIVDELIGALGPGADDGP